MDLLHIPQYNCIQEHDSELYIPHQSRKSQGKGLDIFGWYTLAGLDIQSLKHIQVGS